MEDQYGPPLPPGFMPNDEEEDSSDSEACKKNEDVFIGPQCPSSFLKAKESTSSAEEEAVDLRSLATGASPPSASSNHGQEDSDSNDAYGPMPSNNQYSHDYSDVIADVEKRANNMKKKLDGSEIEEPKKIKREEWMTTPNTSRSQLGAISRCLTHDPKAEKEKKSSQKKEKHRTSERDEKLSKELKKYNKSKRSKSLLEMHQKKKKEKESKKPKERKPFDRDAELSLRFMDDKQIGSVIKKSKLLDSRFKQGQAKYL